MECHFKIDHNRMDISENEMNEIYDVEIFDVTDVAVGTEIIDHEKSILCKHKVTVTVTKEDCQQLLDPELDHH